jgi:hypothetical protein
VRHHLVSPAFELHAHEVHAARRLVQRLAEPRAQRRPVDARVSHHAQQRRSHELLERDHRRDGVAGQAEHQRTARLVARFEAPERERVTGPHLDTPEEQPTAELAEYVAHVVAIAHGHAGRAHDHVRVEPGAQTRLHVFRGVPRDAQIGGFGADLAALGGQRVGIRRDDAAVDEVAVGLDQLVAARDEGDPRALVHPHEAAAQGDHEAHVAGADADARVDRRLAGPDVLARAADVVARRRRDAHRHALAANFGVLLAHHRVGAGGNHRTGEDASRLASPHRPARIFPRRDAEGQLQADGILSAGGREIRGAHRVAVHGRVVDGGQRPIRRHGLHQHAAGRLGDGERLRPQQRRVLQNDAEGFRRCDSRPHVANVPGHGEAW